jgi:hypothetical protein
LFNEGVLQPEVLAKYAAAFFTISRSSVTRFHYGMGCRKLHTDDTPVPVLAPGRKKMKTGRI